MQEATDAMPTVRPTRNALRPTEQPRGEAVTPFRTPLSTPRDAVDDRRNRSHGEAIYQLSDSAYQHGVSIYIAPFA